MRARALLLVPGFATASLLSAGIALTQEQWVSSIGSSSEWAVFPCSDWLVTKVCGTDKDYSDLGTLPPVISVGDTLTYADKKGSRKQFTVRHISFFVYDKDVDFTYGGQRLTAKRGDTICKLYDARSRADTDESEYPSKVVIKECRVIR